MPNLIDPNEITLYAGISGVEWDPEPFDFGNGVILSPTYAHLMSPYVMAFARPEPGKHHPAPWKSANGGRSFDITLQLCVPGSATVPGLDHLNTVWWFIALLRLKTTPFLRVPVVSDQPFAAIPDGDSEPNLWPIETSARRILIKVGTDEKLNREDLEWIGANWDSGSELMTDRDFRTAFSAFDQCVLTGDHDLALVMLWGALERLFSPARHELRFRVSATIASYLNSPGAARQECFGRVKKLYDARSKVAHGSGTDGPEPLMETYILMRAVLQKMIEEKHVPKREELEASLFGV